MCNGLKVSGADCECGVDWAGGVGAGVVLIG